MINDMINKNFFNMENLQIISSSVVIIDKILQPNLGLLQQIIVNENDNPFLLFNNILYLKDKIGMQLIKTPSSDKMMSQYLANNIEIVYNLFPARFVIKQKNPTNMLWVCETMLKMISSASIQDKIGGVGINYELFIPNEANNNIALSLLNKNAITQGFTGVSTTLQKQCNDYLLTLKIAGADIDGRNGAYCDINFHYNINNIENISEIMNTSKLDIAKSEVSDIFSEL